MLFSLGINDESRDFVYKLHGLKRRTLVLLIFFMSIFSAYTQQNVGIGTASPDNSALLDLVSNAKGLLVPRMTTAQRDIINSPATGLLIYNTVDNRFEYNAGTPAVPNWLALLSNVVTLPAGTSSQTMRYNGASSAWEGSSALVNDGTNIGIGISSPTARLDVNGAIKSGGPGTDGELRIYSEQGATDYSVSIQPNPAMTQNTTYTLPPDDGAAGQVLSTNGSGGLGWATTASVNTLRFTTVNSASYNVATNVMSCLSTGMET
jgi:hypothetical protein